MEELLRAAIVERRRASLSYKGTQRIIDPYLLGINKKGNEALRAFQVAGYSSSGDLPAWRLYLVRDIDYVELLEDHFQPRPDYNPNDSAMTRVLFRV